MIWVTLFYKKPKIIISKPHNSSDFTKKESEGEKLRRVERNILFLKERQEIILDTLINYFSQK